MKQDVTPFMAIGDILFEGPDGSYKIFCKKDEIFTSCNYDEDSESVELMIIRKNRQTKKKSTKKVTLLRTEFEILKKLRHHSNKRETT